ncbi:MAG TPA: hypothetical protein VHI14_04490 [Jatrophihabitantaceae bacterium]|jgi:hypothetical protein|nr:hypothetical protein [Jatrophihabitantaceae bacterium]
MLARVQVDEGGRYIAWLRRVQPTPAGTFMLDSFRLADNDELDMFPLNEKKVYLHDHSPPTRTMGSCRRCGAYQVSIAEVTAALNAGKRELVLPATAAWRPAPDAPHRLT